MVYSSFYFRIRSVLLYFQMRPFQDLLEMLIVFSEVPPLWLAGTHYHFRSFPNSHSGSPSDTYPFQVCVMLCLTNDPGVPLCRLPAFLFCLTHFVWKAALQILVSLVAPNCNLHHSSVRLPCPVWGLTSWIVVEKVLPGRERGRAWGSPHPFPFLPVITSCPACNKASENSSLPYFIFMVGGLIWN